MTAAVTLRIKKDENTQPLSQTKTGKWNKAPLQTVDQIVVEASKKVIQAHQTLKTLPAKVKECVKANVIENEANIFKRLLNCKKLECNAKDIAAAVKHCVRRASDQKNPVSEDEATQIRKFFDKLSNVDTKLFDRNALLAGKFQLQCVLSSELDALLKQQKADPALKNNTTHQLNIAIAKARLSMNLGHGMESANQGQNGTVLIKSLENQYVGVFKAPSEIKWYHFRAQFKQCLGQARLLNQADPLAQQFSEVAAHKFDKAMGFNLAPAAKMAEIKGQHGAFIAFLPGYKQLKNIEAELQKRNTFSEQELNVWQKMSVFNFVTGGMDPHAENIFVKTDDAGKLSEMRVIDHGNSFIEKNPGNWGAKGNQGHWGSYKISNKEFTPEVREFILNNLTEENYEKFLQEVGGQRQEYWSQRMDHNQRLRLQVLKECVASGKIKTPKELAAIHTTKDYEKHLKEIQHQPVATPARRCEDGFVVVDIA